MAAMVVVEISFGQCVSNSSGNWNDPSTWSCGRVPQSTDNVEIQWGHNITFPSSPSQITVNNLTFGGTLNVNGNLTINGSFSFLSGSTLNVGGSLSVNDDVALNGASNIGGTFTTTGNLTIGNGESLTVGGALDVEGHLSNGGTSNIAGIVDVSGNFTNSNGVFFKAGDDFTIGGNVTNGGELVSDGDLDISGTSSFASGTLVVVNGDFIQDGDINSMANVIVVGDYISDGNTDLDQWNGSLYVFGDNNSCVGDCALIKDLVDWVNQTTPPGQSYAIVEAGDVDYAAPGSYTFTVPEGVTYITVQVWGGGGRGGQVSGGGVQQGGGGGGGGAYSRSFFEVNEGDTYEVFVGNGSTSQAEGGDSYFGDPTIVLAKGGKSVDNNTTTGASGGLASEGIGQNKYNGGDGANSSGTSYGGGGGSSAGTNNDGTSAVNNSGAIAPTGGGNGGDGRLDNQGNGSSGGTPGGGGGGALKTQNGNTILTGGSGANGQVSISWTEPTPTLIATPTNIEFGYTEFGNISAPISYSLSGIELSADGTITITSNQPFVFQVSLSENSGYSGSVSVDYTGTTLSATTIWVRFEPSSADNDFSGNITNTGGGTSTNVTVSGTSSVPDYCPSSGSAANIGINSVNFVNINNTGTAVNVAYSDFTGTSTTLVRESNNNNLSVNLTLGQNSNYNVYVVGWVDWNKNGSFDDAGESFNIGIVNKQGGTIAPNPVDIDIDVPSSAQLGETRLRISAKRGSAPSSCETGFTGEVEDYTVNICTAPPQPGPITGNTTPCPGATGETYSIDPLSGVTSYTWTVPTGWNITAGQGTTEITVSTGSSGGDISVVAENDCGTSDPSVLSVSAEDNDAPVITCPANQTFDANNTGCTYEVVGNSLDASATDNCVVASITHNYNGGGNTLSGQSFPVGTTTVTWTATDGGGNSSTCNFDITVENPLSATVTQLTPDNECPQLDPSLGFEPNNDGPYNAGSSEIQFQVQSNAPTTDWSFDFDFSDANGLTGFVVDSVNATGNSSYNEDILSSSGTFSSIPAADDLITITARVKNIPGEQVEVDFNVTNITDSNGCSTDYTENRDTVIMNIMPVVGQFE